MKRGIIFDLDGTLWDSCRVMADAWMECIRIYWPEHFRVITPAQMYSACGKTMDDFARFVLADLPEELNQAIGRKCEYFELDYMKEHCGDLYPGLEETLARLREMYHLFIVSNCQDGYIETFMQASGMGGYIEDIESYGRTGMKKHENIRLLMQRNGLDQAVYVGDTRLDRKSSDLAGIPFIHARYGFEELIPDVPSIDSLPELVQRAGEVFDVYEEWSKNAGPEKSGS